MSVLKFIYFSFQGSIGRRTWWLAWALLLMAEVSANYVLSKAMDDDALWTLITLGFLPSKAEAMSDQTTTLR